MGKVVQIYAYPGPDKAKWYLTVSEYQNGGVDKYPTFTPEDGVRLVLHESSQATLLELPWLQIG